MEGGVGEIIGGSVAKAAGNLPGVFSFCTAAACIVPTDT